MLDFGATPFQLTLRVYEGCQRRGSFISRLRDELLNREVFANLKEAKVLAKDYREHYNHHKPHGALGYLTPAEAAAVKNSWVGVLIQELRSYNPYQDSHRDWYRARVPARSSVCSPGWGTS